MPTTLSQRDSRSHGSRPNFGLMRNAGTFPGQDTELKDDTHFTPYGAYELARSIVARIEENKLGIAKYLVEDAGRFDPAHPDPVSNWSLPPSPFVANVRPEGN